VEVGNPDLIGRVQILRIHSKGIKLAKDFDLERAARITRASVELTSRTQ
jgi:ATP-dependent Zn protease